MSPTHVYLAFPKNPSLRYKFYDLDFAKRTFTMKVIFKAPVKIQNLDIHVNSSKIERIYHVEFPISTTNEIFALKAFEENGFCFVEFPKKTDDVGAIVDVK